MIYLFDELDLVEDEFLDKVLSQMPSIRAEKIKRLKHRSDRANSIIAYAMLMCAVDFDNGDYRVDENGKPYIFGSAYRFSISHTDGAVALAVSKDEIGVDVQSYQEDYDRIAQRVCNQKELQNINNKVDFTAIWTRKEAYLKQSGIGIACDMKEVDTTTLHIQTHLFDDYALSVCALDEQEITKVEYKKIKQASLCKGSL